MSFATLLATRTLINEFKDQGLVIQDRIRNFLRNEVVTTQLGYGSYRVNSENPEHYESLLVALQSGINLIDTSSNFSYGSSEQLIGSVLKNMNAKSVRENFILISKAGYIQGPDLEYFAQQERQGKQFLELLKPDSVCWYSIHPDFLRYQFLQSLERLQTNALDVYLIQNPEFFFYSSNANSVDLHQVRKEFYRRLQNAFEVLELFCKEGLLRYYGLSSNTLYVDQNDYNFVSLDEVLQCAQAASKKINADSQEHHFQVIQFPANLVEHQFITQANHRVDQTWCSVLERADQLKLDVLFNRPLCTFVDGASISLARKDFEEGRDYLQELGILFQRLKNKENFILQRIKNSKDLEPLLRISSHDQFKIFSVGGELQEIWLDIEDSEHFQSVVNRYLIPHTQRSVDSLMQNADRYSGDAVADIDEYLGYFSEIEDLGIKFFNQSHYVNQVSPLFAGLESLFLSNCDSWVTASLRFLADLPGNPIVLNGMRHKNYVKSSGEFLIEERYDYKERLGALKAKF